jgi:hypothetical protein
MKQWQKYTEMRLESMEQQREDLEMWDGLIV